MNVFLRTWAVIVLCLFQAGPAWTETECGLVAWEADDAPPGAEEVVFSNESFGYSTLSYRVVEGVFLNQVSITFYEDPAKLAAQFEKRRESLTWANYPDYKWTDDGVYINCASYGQVLKNEASLVGTVIFKKAGGAPQCGEVGGYWTAFEGYRHAALEAVYKNAYVAIEKSMAYCEPPPDETYETNRWCLEDYPRAEDVYGPVEAHYGEIRALIDRKCELNRDPRAFSIDSAVSVPAGETRELAILGGTACEAFTVTPEDASFATGRVDTTRGVLVVEGHVAGPEEGTALTVSCGGEFPVQVRVTVTRPLHMDPYDSLMFAGDTRKVYFSGGAGTVSARSEEPSALTAEVRTDEYGSWIEVVAVAEGEGVIVVFDGDSEIRMEIRVLRPDAFVALPGGAMQQKDMVLEYADFMAYVPPESKGSIYLRGGNAPYDYVHEGGAVTIETADPASLESERVEIAAEKVGTSHITFRDDSRPEPQESSVTVHVVDHHFSRLYDLSLLYIPYLTLSGKTYQGVFVISDTGTPLRFTFVSGKEIEPYQGTFGDRIAWIDPARRTVTLPVVYVNGGLFRANFLMDGLDPLELVLLSIEGVED